MCTGVRFSDDEGNTYFGRNLDWSFSYGETILVTPRGYRYDYAYGPKANERAECGDRAWAWLWPIAPCISIAPTSTAWPSPD